MIKILLLLVSIFCLVGMVCSLYLAWPDQEVHVIFCDVGQGDATLITQGFTEILIDGGRDQQVQECLAEYLPWWDRQIELVIATHADADHIGGLPGVFDSYQIQTLMIRPAGKNTPDFKALRKALLSEAEQGMQIWKPESHHRVTRGNVDLHILLPMAFPKLEDALDNNLTETQLSAVLESHESSVSNYNDGSIVLLLRFDEVSVWLGADQEVDAELAAVAGGVTQNIDVLKAGHHGSKTSSSGVFLEKVQPEYTVISCGIDNQYGHPNAEVLTNLDTIKSKVLRTDQLGTIELITNGQEYWWQHARERAPSRDSS